MEPAKPINPQKLLEAINQNWPSQMPKNAYMQDEVEALYKHLDVPPASKKNS